MIWQLVGDSKEGTGCSTQLEALLERGKWVIAGLQYYRWIFWFEAYRKTGRNPKRQGEVGRKFERSSSGMQVSQKLEFLGELVAEKANGEAGNSNTT